jgi:hypothetical protein
MMFSTWMLESQRLDEGGEVRLALGNLGVSLLVGLAAGGGRPGARGLCHESGLPQPHLYFVESGDRLYVGYANASIPTGIVYPGPNVGPQSPERRRRWRRFVLRFRLLADNPRCLQRRSISLSGRTIFRWS